jgi:predicted kinase
MKKFLEKIEEDMQTKSPVVMAFGRMNPPTVGHEKLVNRVKEIANDYGAPHHVVISHSVDAKKNPLDSKTKLKHAKRFFPNTNIQTSSKESPTFLNYASKLHAAGHDHLVMVAGSDRIPEYEKKLNQYNGEGTGKLFNFKKIELKSAGQRDPDSEGVEGMSASKMRDHANKNEFHEFKKGIPEHVPEKHARELFKDVRHGMGLHESVNHGLFKAIFVSGGPGSGKDIVIREAIAQSNAVEINSNLAISILNDKHKLSEQSKDFRKEAIRNRLPLIINGTSNEEYNIFAIKEELEELGYETMMIFVNTTNEASKKRNEGHERILSESVRQERWDKTQLVAEKFNQSFSKYLEFDNSLDLTEATMFEMSEKEEDISIIYEMSKWFFDTTVDNEIAESWLEKHKKNDINKVFESFITNPLKGRKYVTENKTTTRKTVFTEGSCSCAPPSRYSKVSGYKRYKLNDNICPSCQLTRKAGRADDVRDGDTKSNTDYTFRTYHEAGDPTITKTPEPKETRFQQDNDKQKVRKQKAAPAQSGKVTNTAGVSPEYDTRGQGSVYPMSGLSTVTYREQKENKYTSTAEVKHKSFMKFRKESIDSPSTEMGVTGGYHGPSNKEPIESMLDKTVNQNSNIKKKKK